MNIIVVTPPPVEPVTDEEAFLQLRLDDSFDPQENIEYAAVMAKVAAAREQCEQFTRRAFVQQTVRMVLPPPARNDRDRQWLSDWREWGPIDLLRPPVIEVVSVTYYDENNATQTVDSGLYFVTAGLVPQLCFTADFSNPGVYLREDAIQVEYVVGYPPTTGDPIDYRANVPNSIKQAILLEAQMQYDELMPDKRASLEKTRDALLSSYRIHTF